jgi:tRNA threonylcarbamoyladenosine biosynthesis protein TsaE
MVMIRRVTHAYEETIAFAAKFAKFLKRGDTVCLFGDLGSGKTAFVKGMAKGLKIAPGHVHSPTFTLMNIYEGQVPIYHFDLYRITAGDLFGLGYEEFFYGNGVAAVEWSERLEGLLPKEHWHVTLKHAGDDKREIAITVQGQGLQQRFSRVKL